MIKKIGYTIFKCAANLLALLFSFTCIYSIFWMFTSSLMTDQEFMTNSTGLPDKAQWGNYVRAFQNSSFVRAFLNSGCLALVNIVLVVVFSFIVGYFVSRYQFRFRNGIYLLFLSGMVIPVLALLIPIFIEFKVLGLLDHWYTLTIPYMAFGLPFSVIIVDNYIRSIPREMDEAACIEGCSTFYLLKDVIFPMCKPVLSVVAINSFMGAWNEFPFGLVLINDEKMQTISIAIRNFNTQYTIDYPMYMCVLLISIMPVLVLYLVFCNKIMEGMTLGAVKG